MKTLKQITLLCLFWMIGMSALAYDFAVENADGVTIYYNITSSTSPQTVAVTNDGDTEFSVYTAETINIPNTVTYNGNTYGVTGIGEEAFYNATTVKSITLPKYLTSIGIYAFYGCSSLASITIPNSVTSIGSYAFYGCSSLASITIPNSVTRIGVYAFKYCSSLPVIDNIRYADTYLVEAVDKSMNEYSIKDGTKWIGDYAFYDCRNLISITIPDSVTSIGYYAFEYCSNLTSVTLPNSLTTIDNQAFCYTGLKQLSIPASVTNIGFSAFAYTSLEEVRIEDGDEFLNMYGSFYWRNSLAQGATFYQTRGIKKLYIGRNISSDCFAYGGWNGSASSIESIEIGAKGHYDESLESMNNLKYIRCYGGLKSIAKGLKNKLVCVPKGLKNEYLKMSCWQGNTIVEEGEVVQDICGDSISWTLNVDEEMLTISGNGQIAPSMFSSRFPWHKYTYIIKNIIIEDSINSIRGSEFYEYSNLASVTLSNSVTSIGNFAFKNCNGLTSVTIGNSVTSIGTAAFLDCIGLTSVTIPNSVTSIGDYAFSDCTNATIILTSKNKPTVGKDVFNKVKAIYYPRFYGWSTETPYMPYTTLITGANGNYIFEDLDDWGELEIKENCKEYKVIADVSAFLLGASYTRTFNNHEWQSWYIPADVPFSSLSANFEVAQFSDTQTSANEIEIESVTSGTLTANTPYLVRLKDDKATGEYSIVADESAGLKETVENEVNIGSNYKLKTTYRELSGAELKGKYALSEGKFKKAGDSATLKPFRVYLEPVTTGAADVLDLVMDGATDITLTPSSGKGAETIYNLNGQAVGEDYKGVVIKNGKKVFKN